MFAMDDSGHRDIGRPKQDHYKLHHTQWMPPSNGIKDSPSTFSMKFFDILNERDTAIRERNMAISEKKSALAERDMAIMQRDAAISERNNAIMERDNAIAALSYRDNSALNNVSTCPPGCGIPRGAKHLHHQQHMHHHQLQFANPPYISREMHIDDAIPISDVPTEAVKPRQGKRTKELKSIPLKKPSKPSRKDRRKGADLNNQVTVAKPYEWKNEQFIGGGSEDFSKQHSGSTPEWKGCDLGLTQVNFDNTTVPVPVCSCTGVLQHCYKWGKGGWQSACCTTTLSMYPLPVMPNKRNSRLGGRKMSGGAFAKLLNRLAAEGHDISTPVDLKEHWSKHGTNRYITIK